MSKTFGKPRSAVAAAVTLACSGAVLAQDADIRDQMRYLEERVQVLENGEAQESASPITFGGLIEIEYGQVEDYTGTSTSDVVLATVELAAEAQINEWTRAELVLLYEEDDTPLEVDVGVLSFGNPDASPFFFSGGQLYVPFGNFESGMVSDPLTLELGETRESALLVGFETGGLYGAGYLFNGDVEDSADDKANRFGAHIGWAWEGEGSGLDVGASYIGNLADSDALQGMDSATQPTGTETLADGVADTVPGIGIHAIYSTGAFTVIGEYLGATDAFDPADVTFNGAGAEPSAWNLEVGYGFDLGGREAAIAVGHQRSSEALALELPESKSLVTFSVGVMDNAALSFEYAVADDYSLSDTGNAIAGTGEKETSFTVQLAAEF